jgi:hypothetical protein
MGKTMWNASEVVAESRLHKPMWNMLWQARPSSRIALAVWPSEERLASLRDRMEFALDDPPRPSGWTEKWRANLVDELYQLVASMEVAGDGLIALHVPRWLHGQSQGIVELFGGRIQQMADGNVYAWPLDGDPDTIDSIQPRAIESGIYWNAVEWVRYARAATAGSIPIRMPIMVGPLDTANYLLGTTVLLEWVFTQPEVLHRLLAKITHVLIAMIGALQKAAGETIHSHHFWCMRGGYDVASEVRSLISREVFEEFEAPYLERIGQRCGPYGIHSCGGWERSVLSSRADSRLRAMNGQVRENDLATLCRLADGKVALSIGPSINVNDRYTWPRREDFFRHVMEVVPASQPFETCLDEAELPLWLQVHRQVRGVPFELLPPLGFPG